MKLKPAEDRFNALMQYTDPVVVMGRSYDHYGVFPQSEIGRLNRLFRLAMVGKKRRARIAQDDLVVGEILVERQRGKTSDRRIAFSGREELVAKLGLLSKEDLERAKVRYEIDVLLQHREEMAALAAM